MFFMAVSRSPTSSVETINKWNPAKAKLQLSCFIGCMQSQIYTFPPQKKKKQNIHISMYIFEVALFSITMISILLKTKNNQIILKKNLDFWKMK